MKALRILIVEDDAVIGMHLAEVLEGMGHEICAIEGTEADAVVAADRFGPDLMIVDAWLRSGSGISAVETICANRQVPHLFISGDVASVKAARPGAIVVQKPFREETLTRAIQRILDTFAAP